jgi:epoxyqueuosine reductase QueG
MEITMERGNNEATLMFKIPMDELQSFVSHLMRYDKTGTRKPRVYNKVKHETGPYSSRRNYIHKLISEGTYSEEEIVKKCRDRFPHWRRDLIQPYVSSCIAPEQQKFGLPIVEEDGKLKFVQ